MGLHLKDRFGISIEKYSDSIVEVCGAISVGLIFFSGVGRYRTILVYAIYSFIRALALLFGIEKYITPILLPATIVSMFYDFTSGPIFPIFAKNNIFVALLVMIIGDALTRNMARKTIASIAKGELFVVCPVCRFENKELVKNCLNCNYKVGGKSIKMPNNKGDINIHQIETLLPVAEDEKIQYQKRLTRNIAYYKNGERKLRKHLIITTKNVLFVDCNNSFNFNKNIVWREKDIIKITEIEAVECRMKSLFMAKRPFLVITSKNNDIYEIAFSSFSKYKEELVEIANIIKLENSQVRVSIDLI